MDARTELREAIGALPAIDAHEHLRSHDQCQPETGVTDFMIGERTGSYLKYVLPFSEPDPAAVALDAARPDRERWAAFRRLWPSLRFTGYGNVMARVLGAWGLAPTLDDTAFDVIAGRLAARSPAYSRAAFDRAGIRGVITHYLGHPACGGVAGVRSYLDGELAFDPGIRPLLGTLRLHQFANHVEVLDVGRAAGRDVGTMEGLESAVSELVAHSAERGVVGLKDHGAYTRGLAHGRPDRAAAEGELRRLLAGERFEPAARRLSDYLFDRLLRQAADLGLPVAIHTGYLVSGAEPRANVRRFRSMLAAHPRVRFDLYHLNHPWMEDLVGVLKAYPNAWTNACWTHMIDPAYTIRFLEHAVGTIPAGRVIGFGGDMLLPPDAIVAHLELARDNIAAALGALVARGWCSGGEAVDIAHLWLYENPKALYLERRQ